MNTFGKILLTALLAVILLAFGGGIYKAVTGNYFENASFITSGLVIIFGLAFFVGLIYAMKKIWVPIILFIPFLLQACSYAKSNQQVVVSTDCGMTWKKINIGDAVPRGTGNRCFMKVVMPNYPMQGESKFISNFKEKVRASIHVDYDYSITEPLAFIKQAKYLGTANTDPDSDEALNGSAFETAENSVIDKRLREVVKGILITQDIVEADQADLENHILDATNKILQEFGVKLNFITLTFDLDEQTRQAIDVATAMKIYDTKSLGEVGKGVITARAGATKITVENKPSLIPEKD
jgi:hypothetical protein